MDPRTKKRLESVQHIKAKPYFRPGLVEEPNPLDETCSTRTWKYKMREWVLALKKTQTFDQDQLPQQENPAHDVTAGSQPQ